MLWGLLLGTLCYYLLMQETPELASLSQKETIPFFLFLLEFDAGVLLSFLFCYLALFINELGSIQGVGKAVKVEKLPGKTSKGLALTGIMNSVAGILGVIGPVGFSFSPRVIIATGCASRYALLPSGLVLLLADFFSQ